MKNFIYLIFFFSSSLSLIAQDHPTCDGMRYRTNVFTEINSTKALKYGEGTTVGGNLKELFLDVYEPVGDTAEKRPVIILAFGGSFIAGNRDDVDWLCEDFAKKGFVAVTIDYRLYDKLLFPFPTELEMQDEVIKTISDMKAAVRFIREDADTDNQFRVDPNLIFVGGISAGAIAAAHAAVLDSTDSIAPELMEIIQSNGGFDGNSSNNLQYPSDVQGFVNFSGGLSDASWIDANAPPFFSVHDEFDQIIPFGVGYVSFLGIEIIPLEGSKALHQVADSIGIKNSLHTIIGSNDHLSYLNSNQMEGILNEAGEFFHDIICGEISSVQGMDEKLAGITIYPNPTSDMLFIKSEQGLSTNLTLFNGMGQPINQWKSTTAIDLSSLTNGVYFLNIEDKKSKASVMQKVLINR